MKHMYMHHETYIAINFNHLGGKDCEMSWFYVVIVRFIALLFQEGLLQTADFCRVSSTIDDKRSTKVAQVRMLWSLRQLG